MLADDSCAVPQVFFKEGLAKAVLSGGFPTPMYSAQDFPADLTELCELGSLHEAVLSNPATTDHLFPRLAPVNPPISVTFVEWWSRGTGVEEYRSRMAGWSWSPTLGSVFNAMWKEERMSEQLEANCRTVSDPKSYLGFITSPHTHFTPPIGRAHIPSPGPARGPGPHTRARQPVRGSGACRGPT